MSFIFFLLFAVAIFTFCTCMTDTHILPKWLFTLGMAAIVGMVQSIILLFEKQCKSKGLLSYMTVAFLCFCQSVYSIMQEFELCSSNFSYQVVGSFDNPAGLSACLSLGIPSNIYLFYVSDRRAIKGASVLMALFIAIALFLSESRAGILSGLFLPIIWLAFAFTKKRGLKFLMLGICIFLMPIIYMLKKDSADGRLGMLRCGWEMVKERPIFGHGIGGVQAHYMDYQAKWLSQHVESGFYMLADNVKSVFNEYLTIGICYGIVGWLLLGVFICLMIHCYLKSSSEESQCALMMLAVIGVQGCFSYPFSYPFTWVVLALSCYVLLHNAYPITLPKNKLVRCTMAFALFCASSFLLYGTVKRTRAELEWGKISQVALMGRGVEVLPRYESLMPILGNEPYFLYNYAAELYMVKRYEEALKIGTRCRVYWADYDLELLLGELYEKLYQYEKALEHFEIAHNMCPNRFVPLYKLFKIYKALGDTARVISIGNEILTKRVKVPSRKIDIILNNVRYELQKIKERDITTIETFIDNFK